MTNAIAVMVKNVVLKKMEREKYSRNEFKNNARHYIDKSANLSSVINFMENHE